MNRWFSTSFIINPSSQKKAEDIFYDNQINQLYAGNEQPLAQPGVMTFKLVEGTDERLREKVRLLIKRAKEIDPNLSHKPIDIKDLNVVKTAEGPAVNYEP